MIGYVVDSGDFLKVSFALIVNIYLQNMIIKRRFAKFDLKSVFACSLSPSIINNVFPNFRSKCAMALPHEFELSTLPSIPSNGHVVCLC